MKRLLSIILLTVFLYGCSSADDQSVMQTSPTESAGLQANDFAVIIDVRSDGEWQNSHIEGAIHIPLAQLQNRLDELKSYQGKQLIIQCAVGGRSTTAVEYLQRQGFDNISNMTGGIIAWQKANLPLK